MALSGTTYRVAQAGQAMIIHPVMPCPGRCDKAATAKLFAHAPFFHIDWWL